MDIDKGIFCDTKNGRKFEDVSFYTAFGNGDYERQECRQDNKTAESDHIWRSNKAFDATAEEIFRYISIKARSNAISERVSLQINTGEKPFLCK